MSKTTLIDSRIRKYAYREISQIYQDIGASPDGLSHEQVEAMREKYGANSFTERKNDTMIRRLRRAFINPFNIILFILGIISLVTDVFLVSNFARNATTAIIIFSMILISGAIRLIQELRAKNAAQQLNRLIHESITVRREGELIEISAEKLVVGDIVLLSAGDRVPADIRLTEVTDLFISQAAITGESAILEKSCRALSYSSLETLTQLENLAFMATTVISGKGEGIVLAVGKDTLYGSFAKPDSDDKKSFQKGANSIAWVMLRFIAVLIPIVFALLGVTGGKWLESFAFALSVAVGLMPEMLPMVITACLARGSLTMSRKQTIIKDINAMQGFGSMDVLCMDKTGTLTKAKPTVVDVVSFEENDPDEMLRIAACMEEHFPHSMAKAVVSAARKKQLAHEEMHSKVEYIVAHGISTTIEDHKTVIGSYHFVFEDEKCVIPEDGQAKFDNIPEEYSHLYLAIDGRLAAVICIEDPLREEAKASVDALRAAGISKIVMMTGDSERTAAAIARRVGVDEYYSEVLPEDKANFIEKEKAAGRRVIMVGDGINDSPALSAANVGIAISDGAEIAREIADITVGADDLQELVVLKEISNALMKRIRRNYRFIVTFNAGLIACGVAGILQPTTSALLHNTSTLAISLKSMQNLLP